MAKHVIGALQVEALVIPGVGKLGLEAIAHIVSEIPYASLLHSDGLLHVLHDGGDTANQEL